MGTKRSRTATFSSTDTLRALASPLRMELLQAFVHGDRMTVEDIARRVGKPQSSLYYHIRKLVEVGVLVEVEKRLKGRRYEAVYEVAAERLAIAADPSRPEQKEAASRLIASMLRQAGREFQSALDSDTDSSAEIFQAGRRQRAWLTKKDLEQINQLLDRVEKICIKRGPGEDVGLYSMLSLIVPLEE